MSLFFKSQLNEKLLTTLLDIDTNIISNDLQFILYIILTFTNKIKQ